MLLCTPPEAGTVAEFGQGESGMGENARGNRACTPYGDLTAAIAPPHNLTSKRLFFFSTSPHLVPLCRWLRLSCRKLRSSFGVATCRVETIEQETFKKT